MPTVPTRIFAVRDERTHSITRGTSRELCSVNLTPRPPFVAIGPFVVQATGEVHYSGVSFVIRLSVFRFGGALHTSAIYGFWSARDVTSHPLVITLPVELPLEGGGGAPVPPPQPRAALAVESIDGSGYGMATRLTIAAMQL